MDAIIETGAAATVANILVNLFKLALPGAPSWALVSVAIAAGVLSSGLLTMAGTEPWSQQVVAQTIIQGIIASAAAAGVSRTNTVAEAKRAEATQ